MKRKNLLSLVMGILVLFSASIPIFASNHEDTTIRIEESILDKVYEEIKENLICEYEGVYKLDNFAFDIADEIVKNDKDFVDVDVSVDQTLIRHPSENPYMIGMLRTLDDTKDEEEKALIQREIDTFLKETTPYFNEANRSTFTYTVEIDNNFNRRSADLTISYVLYDRIYEEEGFKIIPVKETTNLRENDKNAEAEGATHIIDLLNYTDSFISSRVSRASFVYDRLQARDYALDHAQDEPEFNSSNHGSDCANFVSKCINYGGVPSDKLGKWYKGSNWGSLGGENWFRTGYNNNGGVVPYMTNKGYFYHESNWRNAFAGSILYRTNTSHVGLVVYGDGETIKYSDHSSTKRSYQSKVWKSSNEPSKFYKPSSSIM